MLTMRYAMKDVGLEFARSLVGRKSHSISSLPYAVLTIGRFGGDSDLKSLEPLLSNSTVCHTWHNGRLKDVLKIQIRDVVLATLVHMTGQDHKEYGFEYIRKYDTTLFHVYTCGFSEEAKRQAALEKWRTWSEKKKTG